MTTQPRIAAQPTETEGTQYGKRQTTDTRLHDERRPAFHAGRAPIGSLGLKNDDIFGYWFDFGDDWWHQINVVSIEGKAGRGRYPKVIKRIGASPPQYIQWEEEE